MSSSEREQDKPRKQWFFPLKHKKGVSSQSIPEHREKESEDVGCEGQSVVSEICDALMIALGVAEKVSAAFGPLQAAVGGLLKVCEVFKVIRVQLQMLGSYSLISSEKGFKRRRSEGFEQIRRSHGEDGPWTWRLHIVA